VVKLSLVKLNSLLLYQAPDMKSRFNNEKKMPPADDSQEHVTGVVESVIYRSEETGYTVCSVKVAGQQDNVTVVGNCAAIWVGETLKANGRWTRHKQHGFQFQAGSINCVAPVTEGGIERYLGSGMIRGVGKVMAKRLVKAFGEETLKIIDKESQRLEEVDGIGPMRRKMIKDSWNEQKAVRDIMIFLQSHGVGTAQSTRIFKHYGNDAVALITSDPYRLCRDIWGIGFKTADSVAMSIGIPPDSEMRACSGIIHVLQTLTDEGHCFCPAEELITYSQNLLEIPEDVLRSALEHEIRRQTLVQEMDRIFLAPLYDAEACVAAKIKKLQRTPIGFPPITVDKAVAWAEKNMKVRFAPMQEEALKMALSEKISIITGGPGVGKTTIIRALVDVFAARNLKIALAAPTGRAAKRMEEATRHNASTLHRMLKYIPTTGYFEHGTAHPLEEDIFILDEVSMVDIQLMAAFLNAIPDHSSLILVGDVDQLPSVGPGNVLRDLIDSNVIPFRKLETIFRQQAGGWIVQNAHRINHGEFLELPEGEEESDFFFIEAQDPEHAIKTMIELVTNRIPQRFDFDPMNDIQVLTPMRRNQLGSENLNAVLQEALNPSGTQIQRFGRNYRVGDRVMQIRNNYDKDVFNGDIGRLTQVNVEEQQLTVNFDGRHILYDFSALDELVHAYACSIHKAQGSEYPAVVILITTQHFKLLQRNLLYTALTRGRKLVCIVGSKKAIYIAIKNNEIRLRRTSLKERLCS
jgi:exodeoxyribonuclease V alpha subunit